MRATRRQVAIALIVLVALVLLGGILMGMACSDKETHPWPLWCIGAFITISGATIIVPVVKQFKI